MQQQKSALYKFTTKSAKFDKICHSVSFYSASALRQRVCIASNADAL